MREDSDVDTFGSANQTQHRITEQAIPPGVAGTVSDEDLRDAFLTRKIDNGRYRIVALQNFGRGSCLFRRIKIPSNRDSLPFGPAGLAHVHRVEFTLKNFCQLSIKNNDLSSGISVMPIRHDATKLVREGCTLDENFNGLRHRYRFHPRLTFTSAGYLAAARVIQA